MSRLLDLAPDHALPAAHPSSRWCAVSTYSRHEKAVKAHLETKAIEVFLPTVTAQSRWKDRNVQLTLPAFPGYVFVRISMQECGRVLSTPGVARILSFNRVLAPFDRAEIDALRLSVDRCGLAVEPHHFLEVGERVRVRAGCLQGLEGSITRKKDACRLILSIALIHQSVAVEIDARLLEILPAMSPEDESQPEAGTTSGSRARLTGQAKKNAHPSPSGSPGYAERFGNELVTMMHRAPPACSNAGRLIGMEGVALDSRRTRAASTTHRCGAKLRLPVRSYMP
jgi:transcription antitermination factor NusG